MSKKKSKGKQREGNRSSQQKNLRPQEFIAKPAALPIEQPQPSTGNQSANKANGNDIPEAYGAKWWRWVTTKSWGWVPTGVVVTAIGSWAAVAQWNSMNEQNELVRQQTEVTKSDLRPHITFDMPRVQAPKGGEEFRGTVSIKNVGKSPATIVWRNVGVHCRPVIRLERLSANGHQAEIDFSPDSKDYDKMLAELKPLKLDEQLKHIQPNEIIYPSDSATFGFGSNKPISEDDAAKFRGGWLGVVMAAHVEYLDDAGKRHTTSACYFYNLQNGGCVKLPRYDRVN
jgi:hypothetical protein